MCIYNRVVVLLGSLFLINNAFGWHLNVVNKTDFVVEAKCKKIGAIRHHPELIQPKTTGEVDCGLADCSTGATITVYELSKDSAGLYVAKDIPLSEKWFIKCGNKTVTISPDGKGSYKAESK